ncbi:MAG TPA: biotin/lipoyl-binding protein, partial [Mycobacteriales bacterium]
MHQNGDASQATHFLSTRVSRQTVADRVDATGNVAPAHLLSLAFSAGSTGSGGGGGGSGGAVSVASGQQVVRTVSVRPGQQVHSGQVLAQLDDSQQQQQLTVAQAQLAAAQAKAAEPVPTVAGPDPGRSGTGTGGGSSASTATTEAQNAV